MKASEKQQKTGRKSEKRIENRENKQWDKFLSVEALHPKIDWEHSLPQD